MTLETSRSRSEASVAREPQKVLKVLNAIRREEVVRSLILFTYRVHLRSITLRTPYLVYFLLTLQLVLRPARLEQVKSMDFGQRFSRRV